MYDFLNFFKISPVNKFTNEKSLFCQNPSVSFRRRHAVTRPGGRVQPANPAQASVAPSGSCTLRSSPRASGGHLPPRAHLPGLGPGAAGGLLPPRAVMALVISTPRVLFTSSPGARNFGGLAWKPPTSLPAAPHHRAFLPGHPSPAAAPPTGSPSSPPSPTRGRRGQGDVSQLGVSVGS